MRRRTLLAVAAIAAIAAAPSAQAHSPKARPASRAPWKVVASGLDNPRGLAFAKNGDIWVAEAGRGGAGSAASPGEEAAHRLVLRRLRRLHASPQRRAEARRHGSPVVRRRGHGRQRDRRQRHHRQRQARRRPDRRRRRRRRARSSWPGRARGRAVRHDAQDRPVERQVQAVRRLRVVRDRQQPATRARSTPTRTVSPSVTAASSSRTRRATTCSASTSRSTSRRWPCSRTCRCLAPPFLRRRRRAG